ncbi:MAG: CapA family protein [Bacteroidetes bacterium]|nr:CapA family protein [Bacteroidota bacterium]
MIKTLFAGDVWLAPKLLNKKNGIKKFITNITNDQKFDIFICNLEAPFRSDNMRPQRRAVIYTEPELLESMRIANINVFTLANNHMNDFGSEGLLKTIDCCKQKGFLFVGAGSTLNEARKPLIIDLKGRKIAIMSYADTSPYVGSIAATENEPGVAPMELHLIREDISKVINKVDDIWVFLHWGKEYIGHPMPEQLMISRFLTECGATMIIGHHPHVLLGYEKLNNTEVYYSIGNFIFPDIELQDNCVHKWNSLSRSSIILKAYFRKNKWRLDRKFLYLNKYGLPEIDDSVKAINRFNNKNRIINNSAYKVKYPFYHLFWKIMGYLYKFSNIRKIWMDILWRFGRKGI